MSTEKWCCGPSFAAQDSVQTVQIRQQQPMPSAARARRLALLYGSAETRMGLLIARRLRAIGYDLHVLATELEHRIFSRDYEHNYIPHNADTTSLAEIKEWLRKINVQFDLVVFNCNSLEEINESDAQMKPLDVLYRRCAVYPYYVSRYLIEWNDKKRIRILFVNMIRDQVITHTPRIYKNTDFVPIYRNFDDEMEEECKLFFIKAAMIAAANILNKSEKASVVMVYPVKDRMFKFWQKGSIISNWKMSQEDTETVVDNLFTHTIEKPLTMEKELSWIQQDVEVGSPMGEDEVSGFEVYLNEFLAGLAGSPLRPVFQRKGSADSGHGSSTDSEPVSPFAVPETPQRAPVSGPSRPHEVIQAVKSFKK